MRGFSPRLYSISPFAIQRTGTRRVSTIEYCATEGPSIGRRTIREFGQDPDLGLLLLSNALPCPLAVLPLNVAGALRFEVGASDGWDGLDRLDAASRVSIGWRASGGQCDAERDQRPGEHEQSFRVHVVVNPLPFRYAPSH